jgi:hypothetical protein
MIKKQDFKKIYQMMKDDTKIMYLQTKIAMQYSTAIKCKNIKKF